MKVKILFLLCFFAACSATAQFNELVLRKNGISKKRYREGSLIVLQSKLGLQYSGVIYLIQNDSIYFSDGGLHTNDIAIVYKKKKGQHHFLPFDGKTFLLANAGVPLFTAGLVISGEPFQRSLLSGLGIVYIPVILYNLQQVVFRGNKRYRIGSKYDLQVLDYYPLEKLPEKKQ